MKGFRCGATSLVGQRPWAYAQVKPPRAQAHGSAIPKHDLEREVMAAMCCGAEFVLPLQACMLDAWSPRECGSDVLPLHAQLKRQAPVLVDHELGRPDTGRMMGPACDNCGAIGLKIRCGKVEVAAQGFLEECPLFLLHGADRQKRQQEQPSQKGGKPMG